MGCQGLASDARSGSTREISFEACHLFACHRGLKCWRRCHKKNAFHLYACDWFSMARWFLANTFTHDKQIGTCINCKIDVKPSSWVQDTQIDCTNSTIIPTAKLRPFSWFHVLYKQDLEKNFLFHAFKQPFWIFAILSFFASSSKFSSSNFLPLFQWLRLLKRGLVFWLILSPRAYMSFLWMSHGPNALLWKTTFGRL